MHVFRTDTWHIQFKVGKLCVTDFCVNSQNDCEEDQTRWVHLDTSERVHFPYGNDWSVSLYKSDGTVGSA